MRTLLRFLVWGLALAVHAGCTATLPATGSPDIASTPSPPSAAPTATNSETTTIPTDTYARVDAPGVPVRGTPGASPDRTKLEGSLPIGLLVYVVDGPVNVDGVDWYLVAPSVTPGQDQPYPAGWSPEVGGDGASAFRSETLDCPPLPSDIDSMIDVQRESVSYLEVACFGGKEIGFEARIGQLAIECWEPWGVDPEWLSCQTPAPYLVPLAQHPDDALIYPVFEPGVDTRVAPHPDAPAPLPIVEIRGKFDHPAARECRNRLNYESEPEPILALTVLGCRSQFVVTAMRAIGR